MFDLTNLGLVDSLLTSESKNFEEPNTRLSRFLQNHSLNENEIF